MCVKLIHLCNSIDNVASGVAKQGFAHRFFKDETFFAHTTYIFALRLQQSQAGAKHLCTK